MIMENFMYEKIIEIIVYVIQQVRQNKSLNDLNIEDLQSKGYSNSEISTALSWLIDKSEITERLFPVPETSNQESFRVLHDTEKEIFTKDAWGELISMKALGIISNENIEMLIDRSSLMGFQQIDTQQVKLFVANSVFNTYMMNPGSRYLLRGNDTIN